MPSIHHLNPPPHPFWDFVANIEDHPFFAAQGRPPHYASREDVNNNAQPPQQAEATPTAAEASEKAKSKQPSAEDPPEVDPSAVKPGSGKAEESRDGPSGRGRCGRASAEARGEGRQRESGCWGRGAHWGAPPPHMGHAFGGPPFGPHMFGPPWARGQHGHPHHHAHHQHHGPPPAEGERHWGHGRRGRHGLGGPSFNLGQFLNSLGERLGVDLSGAAENLGLNQFSAPRTNQETDFEPRGDIFDTPEAYLIHLSLPGAKKEDVGVDWDGENSVLRVAGVVHRPGADEQLLSQLVVDGRKRETGVFEKAIRLGTKNEPASIDVAGISAKMTDGVLVIKVPKVEVEHKKRDVPISGSSSPSPQRNEQSLLFDADEEMYDTPSQPAPAQAPTHAEPTKDMEKMMEYTKEKEAAARDDRSETAGQEEQLPQYQEPAKDESDWEKDDSEEEGEYVKINVD